MSCEMRLCATPNAAAKSFCFMPDVLSHLASFITALNHAEFVSAREFRAAEFPCTGRHEFMEQK
jgi:hypothetical protein